MFDKEAEDNKPPYAFCTLDTKCELWKDGFQKGAEYGYNKAKKQSESIIKRLLINRPDTYSGTDVMTNQTKMFAFASAVNDAIEYLKESE